MFIGVVCLSSCDSQSGTSAVHTGKLRLSLQADTTSLRKEGGSSLTKAVADEFEQFLITTDYRIQILQGDKTLQTFERYDQMPPEIELAEGTYALVASKGDNPAAAFATPYFEGSTTFTVHEGMSTPLDVTCMLANARVTVDYTEDFKKGYAEYATTLSTTFANSQLKIAKDELRPAYMQVAKEGTNLSVSIRLKKQGADTEKTYPVPTPIPMERRQNIHLIFKTDGGATNGIGLDILLDDQLMKSDTLVSIPDFMLPEAPKQENSSAEKN